MMRSIQVVLSVALVALIILPTSCHQVDSSETSTVPLPQSFQVAWVDTYSTISSNPEDWEEQNPFDEDGVVLVNIGESTYYNPVTIAQYAIANYRKFALTGEDKYRINFLNQTEYLRNNFDVIDKDMIGFPYHFPNSNYNLEPVWYSGMAQGQVISVMARAYILSHDETILPLIKKATNFMLCPVSSGGTLTYTPEGNVWIEEYPTREPSLVLNGFVFSIFGLYDYLQIFPDDVDIYISYIAAA